jgi:next to BRCA1 gene 1 protein
MFYRRVESLDTDNASNGQKRRKSKRFEHGEYPTERSGSETDVDDSEDDITKYTRIRLRLKPGDASATLPAKNTSWSVFCNYCDRPIPNEHYHCYICDDDDYDLCKTCVNDNIHCPDNSHKLRKRLVNKGRIYYPEEK